MMSSFDKNEFSSFLLKGQLREAVTYLSRFPEKRDLLEMYITIFENNQDYTRTENEILKNLDNIYQGYYRDVFWNKLSNEQAKEKLFNRLWLFC